MKKFKYLLIGLLSSVLVPLSVNAASGKIAITGSSTVVNGNTATVTVTISSSTAIGSWEVDLNYDKNYLKLTSSTAEAGGTLMVGYTNSASGVKSKTYTFKFKTLKTGSTKLSIDSYDVYANDFSSMTMSAGSKTIKIITQEELEASYSKNNDLGSLAIEGYEISPTFNKETLEYSAVVPEDVKEINILAKASDSKSSVSGAGKQEVTSGINSFEIIVRAENGAEKVYKLNVEVKDANPINVTANKTDYTVVKQRENLPAMPTYQEYDVSISGIDIPAYKNDNTGLILVGLKDSTGEIKLFIYDEKKKDYSIYNEIGVNKITVYPLATDEKLAGYTKGKVKINDTEVDGYYMDKNSRFIVLYGVNVETGEKGFYLYDKENQSIVKYNDEYINELQKKVDLYSYIIIGFAGLVVILLLIIILKKPKKKKKQNPPKVTTVTYDENDNEITEIN